MTGFPANSVRPYTAAVLTVSDRAHRGERADVSGPAVVAALQQQGFQVVATELVPDHRISIENSLIRLSDRAQLVVTTGGTGVAESDVTPEATETVCDRLVPGIPERMRIASAQSTPLAALSRALCGIRGASLILNLPGSPRAATESLSAVIHLLPHALELLSGRTEHADANARDH
ncbi:MAG: molybdenum cofactor biosynthesis protein B [Terriglobales bacterium]